MASLVSGASSPFLLICFLAFAGVHISLWMVLAATVASFGILVSAVRIAARAQTPVPQAVSTIRGITTSAAKKHAPIDPLTWRAPIAGRKADLRIDPENRKQRILGFGGALTGSTCAVLYRMPAVKRAGVLLDLFHPSQMGLNVCRTSMGSSDYSPRLYSYCDSNTPDPELKNFTIDGDRIEVLPVLKEVIKINPAMHLFASPWSPPGWMKPNNTMLGGPMGNTHFPSYAQYFVQFIHEYRKEGVFIRGVTVQNEVQADQGGKMPACTWTVELENDFVANHLGPALRDAGLGDLQIWMMDHNYDMPDRAINSMTNPAVRKFCNAIAWHAYGGTAAAVSDVKKAAPTSHHHFTEFNTFLFTPEYLNNWSYYGQQIGEALNNWIEDYVFWNIALDEEGKPNIGPFQCGGLITINSQTNEVTKSGGYWALGHYSKFVRRGAYALAIEGTVDGITATAFVNPDASRVLVLSNPGPARTVTIECAEKERTTEVHLEADSVTTLAWR